MNELETKFLFAFISLFVAMDPIGLIPFYLGLTRGVDNDKVRLITKEAIGTAAVVAIAFLFLGKIVFNVLGITVSDFKIAGGLILFVLAAKELVIEEEEIKVPRSNIGIVPLGVPLIAGPATLTTLLILIDSTGTAPTFLALILNLVLIYFSFYFGAAIKKRIGMRGLQAFSKIIALLLAALAVNMIRRGLQGH